MSYRRHLIFLILYIFMQTGTLCLADGFYILSVKAYEKLPDIPRQRAFLGFQNGRETLVVESSLDSGEGERFAWILPLPSPPESMEAVDPGVLSTLEIFTKPRFVTRREAKIYRPVLALIVSLLISISIVTFNPEVRRQCRDVVIILGIIIVLGAIAVGGPMLGGSVPGKPSVEALKHEYIGNYEVAVLRGESSQAINQWLEENKFAPLPEKAKPIIDQYIKQDWIFLASNLQRNEKGLLTPHPLKVVFPTKHPVYPMKLTSLVDSGTELFLFVKARSTFSHPSLHIQYADMFHITGSKEKHDISIRSNHFGGYIWNHKQLADLLEDDGWLICFRSRLFPSDMKEDFILEDSSIVAPYRDTFYTPRGAATRAVSLVLWIFTVGFPIIGIVFRIRRKAGKKAVMILAGISVLVAFVYGLLLPVNYNIHTFREYNDRMYRSQLIRDIGKMDLENYSSQGDFSSALIEEIRKSYRNLYTGDIIRIEQSPGNIILKKGEEGKLTVEWYDATCFPRFLISYPSKK